MAPPPALNRSVESFRIASEQGVFQQTARTIAYGDYYKDDRDAGWLWRLIEAEMASSDFHIGSGPLIPGFYLNAALTIAELDRVAQLFDYLRGELYDVMYIFAAVTRLQFQKARDVGNCSSPVLSVG